MSLWQQLKRRLSTTPAKPKHPKAPKASAHRAQPAMPVAKANNEIGFIIAVASGKGGVGKSTVSNQLALALSGQGFDIGLLDADIYGPSQSIMLDDSQQAKVDKGLIQPIEKQGLKYISMSAISPNSGSLVVRSPIAVRTIGKFLNGVAWGKLDILIIDLPPGTGDIQLSIAQKARLSGAIIVTTPQPLAVEIAQKSLDMFRKVNVPVLGVVENMSGYHCPSCHQESAIFDKDGGKALAELEKVPFLGQVPLFPQAMIQDKAYDEPFLQIAMKLVGVLKQQLQVIDSEVLQSYQLESEGQLLRCVWPDNTEKVLPAYKLRTLCRCAVCRDEVTGAQKLDPEKVAKDIKMLKVKTVGSYALAIQFSDGHSTGLYRYQVLKDA